MTTDKKFTNAMKNTRQSSTILKQYRPPINPCIGEQAIELDSLMRNASQDCDVRTNY